MSLGLQIEHIKQVMEVAPGAAGYAKPFAQLSRIEQMKLEMEQRIKQKVTSTAGSPARVVARRATRNVASCRWSWQRIPTTALTHTHYSTHLTAGDGGGAE